jgi:Mrp family chromosome partitioning ATPase
VSCRSRLHKLKAPYRYADGALIVTTPQDVAVIDVRKEVSFCRKTGLPILGVVENMSGLQVPVNKLQFRAADGSDVSQSVLEHLPEDLRSSIACCDVFAASKGGAEAMAKDMGLPFLGRVPLDPDISRTSEMGGSIQTLSQSSSVTAFNAIVKSAPR